MTNILGTILSGISGLLLLGSHLAISKGLIPSYIFTILEFTFWGSFIYMIKDLILPKSQNKLDENGNKIPVTYSKFDFKKMAWLSIIFSGIIFIYTTARQLKDSLVIGSSAGNSGAAVAKILVPVISMVFQFMYMYALPKIEYKKLLYYVAGIFLLLFIGFSIFCVNRTGTTSGILNAKIIPSAALLSKMFGWMPTSIGNIFSGVLGNWPSILFYCLAEIFGSILLTTFFWQLNSKVVNNKVVIGNNRMLMVIAQIASLAAGYAGDRVGVLLKLKSYLGPLKAFNFFIYVVIGAIVAMFIGNYFLFDTIEAENVAVDASNKPKSKGNGKTSWQILKDNPKLILFALLTVFYGLAVVFVEQYWKFSIKQSIIAKGGMGPSEVSGYMSEYSSWYYRIQSRVTLISSIFLPFILSSFLNWTGFALATPLLVLFGAVLTFGVPIIFKFIGITPSWALRAFLGTLVVTALKAAKYILFDSSREIFVKKLPEEQGRELKNFEGLVSRYGKSAGSPIIIFLDTISLGFNTFGSSVVLVIICVSMSLIWLYSVLSVSEEMKEVSM